MFDSAPSRHHPFKLFRAKMHSAQETVCCLPETETNHLLVLEICMKHIASICHE